MKPLITIIQDRMKYDYENNILKAVQSVGIDVDKERLAKAIIDSRSFYNEGYADAKAKYENALNKACEMLSLKAYALNSYLDTKIYMNKDEWKEWCLKDENC